MTSSVLLVSQERWEGWSIVSTFKATVLAVCRYYTVRKLIAQIGEFASRVEEDYRRQSWYGFAIGGREESGYPKRWEGWEQQPVTWAMKREGKLMQLSNQCLRMQAKSLAARPFLI